MPQRNDWIFATEENRYYKVLNVLRFEDNYDDQEWLNMGAPSARMYQLVLEGRSKTSWYTAEELNTFYPVVKDSKTVEVLYGKK